MQIWTKVENILQEADNWCFIGYSLPEADRYFSYILSKIYNFRKVKTVKKNKLPKISVVNTNSSINKYKSVFEKIKTCDNETNETENYFKAIQKGRDVFKRFENYFYNVEKYECSFKDFVSKYFKVL